MIWRDVRYSVAQRIFERFCVSCPCEKAVADFLNPAAAFYYPSMAGLGMRHDAFQR
jgi:hypothetical protein